MPATLAPTWTCTAALDLLDAARTKTGQGVVTQPAMCCQVLWLLAWQVGTSNSCSLYPRIACSEEGQGPGQLWAVTESPGEWRRGRGGGKLPGPLGPQPQVQRQQYGERASERASEMLWFLSVVPLCDGGPVKTPSPPSTAQGYLGPLAGLPRPLDRASLPHPKTIHYLLMLQTCRSRLFPRTSGFLSSLFSVHHLVCPCISNPLQTAAPGSPGRDV